VRQSAVTLMRQGSFSESVGLWLELFAMAPFAEAGCESDQERRDEAQTKSKGAMLGQEARLQVEHSHFKAAIKTLECVNGRRRRRRRY
jgi:hypothetical protein